MLSDRLLTLPGLVHWVDERHLLEFLLLADGRKSVVRVPMRSGDELAVMGEVAVALGATLVTRRRKTVVEFRNELGEEFVRWSSADSLEQGEVVGYLSREPAAATAAESAEFHEDHETLAEWLGYPKCCARAYTSVMRDGHWTSALLNALSAPVADGTRLPWECNKLAYALYGTSMFPDYFPCDLACPGTVRLAREALKSLGRHGLADLAERHRASMRRPILRLGGRLYGVPEGLADAPLDRILGEMRGWQSIALEAPVGGPEAMVVRFT